MTSAVIRDPNLGVPVRVAGLTPSPVDEIYALRLRALLAAFRRQPLSFWLVCLYMLFEYVRPQAIYPFLQPIPWAQLLILAAPIAFFLEGGHLRARNPINLWMVLFTGAVVLSWVTAFNPQLSQDQIFVWVNWVLVYFLVANTASTEVRFFLFFLLFLLASFKMSQHGARVWAFRGFGFANWGATGAPGWFHNSGEFGIQMCVFFPLTLYFFGALKSHWSLVKRMFFLALPATAVMSMVATNSRGALLGGVAVGLWILLRTRYRVRGLVGLGALALITIAVMPTQTRERFGAIGEDETSQNRLTYWRNGVEIFKEHPVTGIGYENWSEYHQSYYGRAALPHNIFIQAGAELGSVGLVALLGLLVASFVVNYRTRKLAKGLGERGRFISMTARGLDGAMIGYLASAFFVTVLYYPYLWFALGMTSALHAAAVTLRAGAANALQPTIAPGAARPAGWRTAASITQTLPQSRNSPAR
jgi:O-antigen ligase